MMQGLRTVIYGVSDIARAKTRYSQALGAAPYFDEPFYVGFNVGGYALGLNPNVAPNSAENAGVVAYWGVEDIAVKFKRLLEVGGKEHSAIRDVGDGIQVETLVDPFGNIPGLIRNPYFKAGNRG